MLKSKTFMKRTRRGGVLKVVREHYLRDDIWCGCGLCTRCNTNKPGLANKPTTPSTVCPFPHYIVLDTNAVLHQMDVIDDPVFCNVIVLQTVLQEVKKRSYTAYKRIRDLIAMPEKHFYVFSNEHHQDTFIERQAKESPNDYNDRYIRVACKWYNKHLKEFGDWPTDEDRVSIVLLTNDFGNKQKATEEGIEVYTVHEYVKSLGEGFAHLVEKLAKVSFTKDEGGKDLFPEHLPLSKIQTGLKTGRFMQGTYVASRENYLEGVVRVPGRDGEIFIQGLSCLNRVVHDDVVAVELLPKDDWAVPCALILEEKDEELAENEQEHQVKMELNRKKNRENAKESGKIVGIIKRKWKPYCGMLSPNGNPKGLKHLFVAANRQIPRIMIESRQAEILRTRKIIVAIDAWPRNSRYPLGHYVRDLGEIGEKATENEVLLLEHDIPHHPFSQQVLDCLPTLPWVITDEDRAERRDLRGLLICSIDPPGCTDIDDTLHCRPLENGNLEFGVHIADVSHFVKHNTAIDEEAKARGTTVYLTDQRIDMLPDLLSGNLCSLHEKVERFAFSCVWEMTPYAEIVSVDFFKSIIKSVAAMTYAEAQMIIDDTSRSDDLANGLRCLNEIAKKLKQKRIDAGALALASTEVRFNIDSETHDPIDLQVKKIMDTNSLVEEFMLLANISVATKLYEVFPQHAVLRKHPIPAPGMFDTLIKATRSIGIHIDATTGKSLQVSLNDAKFPDDPYKNSMLRMLTTRSLTQAVYICSGNDKFDDYIHYGLASPIYTHFTSPIRRYPDLLVHRLLGVVVGAYPSTSDLFNMSSVSKTCEHMNYRHKMAQYAGRASVNLHTQIFFKNRICDEEGYIIYVRKNAMQVLIPKYGLEGTLYLSEKKNSPGLFTFDEENISQTCGGTTFKILSKVVVQIYIERKDVQHPELRLRLVQPVIPGFSVPPAETLKRQADESGPSAKKAKIQ